VVPLIGVEVHSNQSRSGDHFDATVCEPVVVHGKTVLPQGAHARGLVLDAQQSGRLMGRAYTMPRRKAIAYLSLNAGACAHHGVKLRVETPLKFELAEPVSINVKG